MSNRLKTDAFKVFNAKPLTTDQMAQAQSEWMRIYNGSPVWVGDGIRTVNFAKTLCEETARLTALDIDIKIDGSKRAEYLQNQIEKSLIQDARLRKWIEYGCVGGTIFFKPNGNGLDVVLPGSYMVTACDDDKHITGIVFRDVYEVGENAIYTRLEYHDHRGPIYKIKNRTFLSKTKGELGNEVSIDSTIWAGIAPDVEIENIDKDRMLFGVFSLPNANGIDIDSPLSCSLFANAIEELKALDVALSITFNEIGDSEDIVFIDERMLESEGAKKLPKYVKKVFNASSDAFIETVSRSLKTSEREVGINLVLNLIATKCGYSEGYFAYNQKGGITTAKQVESDDRKTIQLVKDIRDALKSTIKQTVYALNAFADIYDLAPSGKYDITFSCGDITYSYDEDRARWYTMATSGMVPKWLYLVKFEGFSEQEARAIIAEAEGSGSNGFFEKEE